MTFKEKVNLLMQEHNTTQQELADYVGTTQATLSRNINGLHSPKAEIVEKIAKFFDVSVDYLLTNKQPKATNRIRKLRLEKGLTLRELSEELNISYSNIAMLERGERNLTSDTLAIFSRYFNVSTDYLLGLSDDRQPIEDTPSTPKFALYGLEKDLTDEQKEAIINLAKTMINKNK